MVLCSRGDDSSLTDGEFGSGLAFRERNREEEFSDYDEEELEGDDGAMLYYYFCYLFVMTNSRGRGNLIFF